jgi:uncharacterized OB-fold protein
MAERRPDRVRGPEHDRFWQHCADGELRIQRCDSCGEFSWPPVQACEMCESPALTWQLLSGRGEVVSWCTFERRYYAELPVPWDTILVRLEEGVLFMSNPHGFGGADIAPDLAVSVRFLDCEDDAGPFRLPVFERSP